MRMLYLSQVLGRPIRDRQGDRIAKIQDLVARLLDSSYPRIIGLVARGGRRDFFVPWSEVADLDETGANLCTFTLNLRPFARREGEALLVRDVLDKQLIDVEGRRVIRANDLQLVPVGETVRVVAVDVSPQGLLRRLGPAALVGSLASPEVIDWADVEYLATQAPTVHLRVSHDRLARLHPVDIARILEALPYRQSAEIVNALDTETTAETLGEISADRQADLVESMDAARAADVLEEMGPDEAADVLADLPPEKAEGILGEMEAESASDVRMLMAFREDTAGGLMTTEFVSQPVTATVAETLECLRTMDEDERPEFIHYVYAVDGQDRLVGVVSLERLVLASPAAVLGDLMTTELMTVAPREDAHDAAQTLVDYHLLALPVVGPDGRMLGVITFDDAIEILLPSEYRREEVRIG